MSNTMPPAPRPFVPFKMVEQGRYLQQWEKDVHPFGKPDPCPFCRHSSQWTAFVYNGPGSPPSYFFTCESCGALGPSSHGAAEGDHQGALYDAIDKWNTRPEPNYSSPLDQLQAESQKCEAVMRDRNSFFGDLSGYLRVEGYRTFSMTITDHGYKCDMHRGSGE